MKVLFLSIFLGIASIIHGNPENKEEIIIHGIIKNSHEPIPYIYLICFGGESVKGDTIKVIDNKYTCIIKTNHVAYITFCTKLSSDPAYFEDKNRFVILAEPGNCNIVSLDSFSNIEVTGSRAYIEYENLKKTQLEYSSEIERVVHLRDSLLDVVKTPDSAFYQLSRKIGNLFARRDRLDLDYAMSSPSSLITPFVLSEYFNHVSDSEVKDNASLYNRLSTAGKNSEFGKDIKFRIEDAKIGKGTIAPQFIQSDTAGKMVSLQSLKGKYVLLEFWASWCLPCRVESTHLTKAFKDYQEKGFTIVSISLDKADAKDKWLNAIKSDGLTWYNISDLKGFENAVAKLYYVNVIPQNFLIDPEGKIIAKNLRNGNLEKKLSEIFSFQ